MPVYIPLDRIEDNPFQPRKHYGADAIEELAESIEREGQIQHPAGRLVSATGGRVYDTQSPRDLDDPSWVSAQVNAGDARVQLAVGHRRARAWRRVWERHAARAGDLVEGDGCPGLVGVPVGTMPVDLQPLSDERMFAKAVEENRHRVDISAVETAEAMLVAQTGFAMGEEEIGRRFGVARSTVAGKLRLLRLPEPVKDLNREGRLSEQKCRQLLRLFSLDSDVEALAVQLDADAVGTEYWTRQDVVASSEDAGSAAEVGADVDEWLQRVEQAAEQARREREPGFFDADPAPDEPAVPSPSEALSAEAVRIHGVLDTHAEHVANLQRRHIVEEVRAAVQALVRRDIANLSQSALRLGDADVSAEVAALHDRAAAEIERYRGVLDGTVGIEIGDALVFLSAPRPLVDAAPAEPDVAGAITEAEAKAETSRLHSVYSTCDTWRRDGVHPQTVAVEHLRTTVRKLVDGERDARRLAQQIAESGTLTTDIKDSLGWTFARVHSAIVQELQSYRKWLAEREALAPAPETVTDSAAAVPEMAEAGPGLPAPVLDEPHLWSALRPVWPASHVRAGKQMLSDEIHDVQARYYLPLLDRYEIELVTRSNVKEDITRGARRAVQFVANLRCAYALTPAQLSAFVAWAEAKLPDTLNGTVTRKSWRDEMETLRLADESYAFGLWSNHDPGAKQFESEDLRAIWAAALVMGERLAAGPVLPATVVGFNPMPRDRFEEGLARLAAAFAYHVFYAEASKAETPEVDDQPSASVSTATLFAPAPVATAFHIGFPCTNEQGWMLRCRSGRHWCDSSGRGELTALPSIAEAFAWWQTCVGAGAYDPARTVPLEDIEAQLVAGSVFVTDDRGERLDAGDVVAALVEAGWTRTDAPETDTAPAAAAPRPGYPARFPRATDEGKGTWETQDGPDVGVRGGDPLTPEDYAAYETALYGRPVTQAYRDELDRAAAHYTNTSVDDARSSLACGFEKRDRASLERLREVLFHALGRGEAGLGTTKHKLFEQYVRKVDKRLAELEPEVSADTSAETPARQAPEGWREWRGPVLAGLNKAETKLLRRVTFSDEPVQVRQSDRGALGKLLRLGFVADTGAGIALPADMGYAADLAFTIEKHRAEALRLSEQSKGAKGKARTALVNAMKREQASAQHELERYVATSTAEEVEWMCERLGTEPVTAVSAETGGKPADVEPETVHPESPQETPSEAAVKTPAAEPPNVSTSAEPNGYVLQAVHEMLGSSVAHSRALLRAAEGSREQSERYRDACRHALTLPDVGKTLRALLESSLKRLDRRLAEAAAPDSDDALLDRAAAEHGVDPQLMRGLLQVEKDHEGKGTAAPARKAVATVLQDAVRAHGVAGMSIDEQIQAVLGGDVALVGSVSGAVLRRIKQEAALSGLEDVSAAVRAEMDRRDAEWDAQDAAAAGDGAAAQTAPEVADADA